MRPVTSSNVDAVGYDAATQTMHVRFKGGATYIHHGVGPKDHAALVGSKSVGSHYHTHFRGKHSGKAS